MLEAVYYISTDPSHQRQSRVILPSKHRSMDHAIPNPGLVVALPPAWISYLLRSSLEQSQARTYVADAPAGASSQTLGSNKRKQAVEVREVRFMGNI